MICSPLKHIIGVINRRNLRLTDNVARMGKINTYKVSVVKREGSNGLEDPDLGGGGGVVDLCGSGYGKVVSLCEHGNEPSGSIKCEECLHCLRTSSLVFFSSRNFIR